MQEDDAAPGELEQRWTSPAAMRERYGASRLSSLTGAGIYSFREPPLGPAGAIDLIPLPPGAAVLDAGCGTGAYLPHLARAAEADGTVVGLDFSADALHLARTAASGVQLATGDVQRLPFRDAAFDVVLSAHMLYHVPDIRAALLECRRVLRAGGALAVVVGSARDQEALDDIFMQAGGAFPLQRYSDRFSADVVPQLVRGIFDSIERTDARPRLVVRDPEVLVTHFEGERAVAEPALRPDVSWERFREAVRRVAARRIEREGAVVVPEEIAVILCR